MHPNFYHFMLNRFDEWIDPPPSPVHELHDPLLQQKQVQFFVKRDDLLCVGETGVFGGNKWRKLKHNLLAARQLGQNMLLTFGGAYSNHLAAVAEAGQLLGFQTIGMVRGEATLPLNPTLQFCKECGMQLHYLDRETYRRKAEAAFVEGLQQRFGEFYLLPEGGTNVLALRGCAELAAELAVHFGNRFPSYCALPCGTGGTLAGLISGLKNRSRVIGFSVLRGDFLHDDVAQLLSCSTNADTTNWFIQPDYHFGGYAKFSTELITFIHQFKAKFAIQLDPIYTGKLFFGLFDLIAKDYFPPGSSIVAIHTGGLQGIAGFEQQHGIGL